jgi:hypothetical protein
MPTKKARHPRTPGRKKLARNQTSTAQRLLGIDLNQALANERNHVFLKDRANRTRSSSACINRTRHAAPWFAKNALFFAATSGSRRRRGCRPPVEYSLPSLGMSCMY